MPAPSGAAKGGALSKRNLSRGINCLVCGRAVPTSQLRGRRQLYCSDYCMLAAQRRQQTLQGKTSGYFAQRPYRGGTGGRPAPEKGQPGHAHGTFTHKPRDPESDEIGIA
jgi:hypothetical protein